MQGEPQSYDRVLSSMCTPPHPDAAAAAVQFLSTNPGDPATFPTIANLEHSVVDTLGDITGLSDPSGYVASGGTEANIQAVHIARNNSRVESPNIVVPASGHFSFRKAAELLDVEYREASLDPAGRSEPESMKEIIDERTVLVVGVAGSTERGCVDPIPAIADIASDRDCLCHVDAAWGGFLLPFTDFSWNFADASIDMLSIDPHKCGRAAIPSGGFLVRNAALLDTISIDTPYLHTEQQSTLGGTRSGAGVASAAAALEALWPDGYEHQFRKASQQAAWLQTTLESMDIPAKSPDLPIVTAPISDRAFSTLRDAGWRLSRTASGDLRVVCMPHVTQSMLEAFVADLDRAVLSQAI